MRGGGRASLRACFAAGGDYVGIGRTGARFAVDAGLIDLDVVTGSFLANGVIAMDFDSADSVAAGYPADSHGFVVGPVWFDNLGSGVTASASVAAGDFFLSGFWTDWPSSGAAGKPIVAHTANGASQVTVDPGHRHLPRARMSAS